MKNSVWVILLCCLWVAASCKKDTKEETPSCVLPDEVSYSQHIQPLFNRYCNTAGCHSGNTPAGNLNLADSVSYAQLFRKGKGYIDTIQPAYSLLYAQMVSVSNPMPPTGNLDSCKINLVFKWITQKAKHN